MSERKESSEGQEKEIHLVLLKANMSCTQASSSNAWIQGYCHTCTLPPKNPQCRERERERESKKNSQCM